MHLLVVPDALNVGLVGEHKRRTHETRIFGQNRRGRHFEYMAFSVSREVIHYQPSHRRLSRQSGSKSLLDASCRTRT